MSTAQAEGGERASSGTCRHPPVSPPSQAGDGSAPPRRAIGRDSPRPPPPPSRPSRSRSQAPSSACLPVGAERRAQPLPLPSAAGGGLRTDHASAPIAAWDRARLRRPARASRVAPRMRDRSGRGGAYRGKGGRKRGSPAPRRRHRARPESREGRFGRAPPGGTPAAGSARPDRRRNRPRSVRGATGRSERHPRRRNRESTERRTGSY